MKPGGSSLDDADLKREVKADEQSYLRYLSRREQARVLDQTPTVSPRWLRRPPYLSPVHGRGVDLPHRAGIGHGGQLSNRVDPRLLHDCVDPCFHTPDQVIETLGIAVVLAVPKMTA